MKKLFTLHSAILAVMLASVCYGQNFIKVTRTNQEQTINLSTDQVLEIQLPRKASTGYVWLEANNAANTASLKTIAQIGDGEYIEEPALIKGKGKLVGQTGTQIIRYVGATEGTTVLTLELRRPWVKNGTMIDSYSITVVSAGKYAGNYAPTVKKMHKLNNPLTSASSTLPTSWDWRTQCTPIENQDYCGDCWAYASVGTLECNISIHDGVTRDISEEFITDCFTDNSCMGCGGGYCAHEAWLASYTGANTSGGGAVYESDDPTTCNMTGATGTCGGTYTPYEKIDSYSDIGGEDATTEVPPVDSIKYHIYNHGPVWITADASNWTNYIGGILNENESDNSSNIDHAIVLVGWKDTTVSDASGGYWIVRNSWGTGWGVDGTGYMYISYASDDVGCLADYIVYKGGTQHNVAPVANFSAVSTSNCNGTILFLDSSYNAPTSWHWNFGDGDTSNMENPSHTYASNGTYNVTLTVYNSYGDSTLEKSGYITISMISAPVTTGASCTGPCSETLSASGTSTLNWYSSASGGTPIGTGTTFITPVLSSTTTYYVQSVVPQPVQTAGMITNTANGEYYKDFMNDGLFFDAYVPLTIDSVTVYEESAGSFSFFVTDLSGNRIDTMTTTLTTGEQVIPLNFAVPAGVGYALLYTFAKPLWMETSGAVYPYTVPGLISITGNTSAAAGYYFYFYNWKVTSSPCLSPMVPVVATIESGANIKEISESNFTLFPNPNTGSFDIQLNNYNIPNATVRITNMLGEILLEENMSALATKHIDVSNLSAGMYYVIIKTENKVAVRKFVKE